MGRQHHNRVIQKLLQGQGSVPNRKGIRICNKNIMKITKDFLLEAGGKPGIGEIAHDQIHLPVFQKLYASNRSAVCDLDPYIRMILMKFLQVADEKIAADRVTCSDPKMTGEQLFIRKKSFSFPQHFQCRLYMLKKQFTFSSQDHFLGAADKKGVPQFLFQSFDGLADSRLGDIELAGSLGKT